MVFVLDKGAGYTLLSQHRQFSRIIDFKLAVPSSIGNADARWLNCHLRHTARPVSGRRLEGPPSDLFGQKSTRRECVPVSPAVASPVAKLSREDANWEELDADLSYMTRTVRLVQWYPGHIAKAERELKEQLKWVDVVLEVRDARIPRATTHPDIDAWIGERKKVIILNREDMVGAADRRAWAAHFSHLGTPAAFTDGQRGGGIMKLSREAMAVSKEINKRRRARGLLPRPVRAAVVGFPNVGKSAVINRLLNRRACESAPRPGVTRNLQWVRINEDLELLDAPGILPPRILDQSAAARLAICNDIGEAAYAVAGVAAILIEMLKRMPTAGPEVLTNRYKVSPEGLLGDQYLEAVADKLVMGDVDQAAHRVLKDFRKGAFGWLALERPPPRGLRANAH